ncbi:helix-turn-helix domain-containing protein [Actinomadura spongiicola]|uniref:helix-turn-helix domain-containing protein n=1 Tax=Actinomadura spongiicola TaxID=2303421 RepID=UPI0011C0FAB4|nr:helix-turn-helix transcriptional regulator [Actinomadura spongiicola]
METTDPAEALNLIMKEHGWSQRQLGRELGGRSQGWVSSVLTGRRDPGIKRYAEYLGYIGWEVVIRPKRENPVKRREFNESVMKIAGAALAGKAPIVFTGPKTPDSPYQDPGYVLGLARRASDMREELGGIPIAQRIHAQAQSLATYLPHGGRALKGAASEFSRQAAWVFCDSGRPDLAERYAGKALDLARKCEDWERQAAAHAVLSDLFLTEGKNADRAAFHAQEGLKLPDVSEGFRAPLKAYMAWALSRKPEVPKRRSQHLIDQAMEASGISPLDSGWVQHASGNVLHNLGEDRRAFDSFEQSARVSEPEQEAHALADAARVALHTRDFDRAAQLMAAVSYLVPLVASIRLDRKTKTLLRESAQWTKSREIRLARELLRTAVLKPSSTI